MKKENLEIIAATVHGTLSGYFTFSQQSFQLMDWKRTSDIYKSVLYETVKYCLGCYHAKVRVDGKLLHDRWMADREDSGWKWGSDIDTDKKEDPYLVPFVRLPETIRIRYDLTAAVIMVLLPYYVDSE